MIKYVSAILLLCLSINTEGQERYSLEEAIKYAQKHNGQLRIQQFDISDAEAQVDEYLAIGYPKVTGSVSYNYFIEIPSNILPDFISPSVYEVLEKENLIPKDPTRSFAGGFPVQFGTKNNLSAGLDFNTLIFDGSFFIGIKAQRLYKDLIKKQINQTDAQVRFQVTKAYLSSLIIKEQLSLLEKNISNLQTVYKETQAVQKNGFAEQLDVDRLNLSIKQLTTQKESIKRLEEITLSMLKFQMGYPLENPIIQTQGMQDILNESFIDILNAQYSIDYNARPEYQTMQLGKELAEINVRRYKVSAYPSLFGFASLQESLQRNDLFNNEEADWLPTSLVGLKLNVPIFDGFDRRAKTRKAKNTLAKTDIQISEFERAVTLETQNAKTNYYNALQTLENTKSNVELAEKIYETSRIKFKEGVGSSFELTQSERDLYTAQSQLVDAQFQLISAKVDLDKSLGKL